jgi:hypothetical protein
MDSDEGEEGVGLPHAAVLRVARAAVPIASFSKEVSCSSNHCFIENEASFSCFCRRRRRCHLVANSLCGW